MGLTHSRNTLFRMKEAPQMVFLGKDQLIIQAS